MFLEDDINGAASLRFNMMKLQIRGIHESVGRGLNQHRAESREHL